MVSAAVDQCSGAGSPEVHHHGANMAKRDEIEDMFAFITKKCGRSPDILVNNAGEQKFE